MEINNQSQKAGDNSQLIQAQTVIVSGISEQRAREIFDEKFAITRKELTQEAVVEAQSRIKKLEDNLIPKIKKVDDGLKAFADPSFQMLLVEAQKTAASTEREEDYDLLSELLVDRIKIGQNRNERAGIHHAIQIIDDISSSALQALTLFYIIQNVLPSSDIDSGLKSLDEIYGKFIKEPLPLGMEWIEHLDLLRALRINSFGRFPQIEDIIVQISQDFAEVGINKDSVEYKNALTLLTSTGLPIKGVFICNPALDNYVRLNITSIEDIESLSLINGLTGNSIPLSDIQKNTLKKIRATYSKDKTLIKTMKEFILQKWLSHSNLCTFINWWRQIPVSFNVTVAGNLLANANANRIDPFFPRIKV